MPQRASWKNLAIGVTALGVVITAAALILIFGRVGTLRGEKYELYVVTDAARGLIRGSEVWLDGQKVGVVKHIDFRPPSASPKERLVLALQILTGAKSHIRRDSRVQIRSGSSVIGEPVVYVTTGTARQPVMHEGDTLRAVQQSDREGLTSDAALASKEFPGIVENVKLLSAQLHSAEGTIGALGMGDAPEMRRLRARAGRLMSDLKSSDGTFGLMMSESDELRARAKRAMSQFDSLRVLLGSSEHSFGRFRRDSTIKSNVAEIRRELADVRRLAADSSGGIGRFRSDSAIIQSIHRDLQALDSLMADMKKRPLRYIAF
jgi:phospholipid/cholesterol/gamma-HCH transport system substrate-binding protein